jgi:hypothetical protein
MIKQIKRVLAPEHAAVDFLVVGLGKSIAIREVLIEEPF